MGNNFGGYIGSALGQESTPSEMRRQRELAAHSRGEVLDEITDVLARAVMYSKNVVGSPGRAVPADSESERQALTIRRLLDLSGYTIVPK